MELYAVIAACAILTLCMSDRANIVAALGVSRFFVAFILICMLCLSRFEIDISPELRLNPGILVIPLSTIRLRAPSNRWPSMWTCVFVFATLSCLAERLVWLYGANNGVLCGLLAGGAGILLEDDQFFALLGVSVIPLAKAAFDTIYELSAMGYGSLDISAPALLNAQILAVIAAVFLQYLRNSERAPAKN